MHRTYCLNMGSALRPTQQCFTHWQGTHAMKCAIYESPCIRGILTRTHGIARDPSRHTAAWTVHFCTTHIDDSCLQLARLKPCVQIATHIAVFASMSTQDELNSQLKVLLGEDLKVDCNETTTCGRDRVSIYSNLTLINSTCSREIRCL